MVVLAMRDLREVASHGKGCGAGFGVRKDWQSSRHSNGRRCGCGIRLDDHGPQGRQGAKCRSDGNAYSHSSSSQALQHRIGPPPELSLGSRPRILWSRVKGCNQRSYSRLLRSCFGIVGGVFAHQEIFTTSPTRPMRRRWPTWNSDSPRGSPSRTQRVTSLRRG